MTHGLSEYGGGLQPPSLHVGVMPQPAWTTIADVKQYLPSTVTWHIETAIHIEASTQFIDPYLGHVPPQVSHAYNLDSISIDSWPNYYMGYKSKIANLTSKPANLATSDGTA